MDHLKPIYHLRPESNWINDPNAPVFWNGEYHIFFQYNPGAPVWGNIHWGHAASPDLVHWELLPPALAPGPERYDAGGVYSGCGVVKDGELYLFYTAAEPQTQCIAIAESRDKFRKYEGNPVIEAPPPGYDTPDFRDPFIWKEGDTYKMILASGLEGRGIMFLYTSSDLFNWNYEGEFYSEELPQGAPAFECPLYFRLESRDILINSPFEASNYLSGRVTNNRFEPAVRGYVDMNPNWYAANTLQTTDGRRVLIAWLREERSVELQKKAGWSGCLSLPRECSVDSEGRLLMKPLSELRHLRERETDFSACLVAKERIGLGTIPRSAEIEFTAQMNVQSGFELRIMENSEGSRYVSVAWKDSTLHIIDKLKSSESTVDQKEAPCPLENNALDVRIFIDASVVEVFFNGSSALSTRIYPDDPGPVFASLLNTGRGKLHIDGKIYSMKSLML